MMISFLSLLVLTAPLSFAAAAVVSLVQPGPRPRLVERLSLGAACHGLLVAGFGGWLTARHGLVQSPMLGWRGFGLSIRLDPLSTIMFGMISLLAFVIVRFSRTYLDGDSRHGAFLGRLAGTIAAVETLVLAGNLGLLLMAWVATSLTLHTLLIFYPERRGARVAARKKFIVARIGDVCLLAAAGLLYSHFGTGDLEAIFNGMRSAGTAGAIPGRLEAAAVLVAGAAILKSAQFPTHGWLVEVMETPTPVSALLHAGILNAGPFLVTRMALVMQGSELASIFLVLFGGGTALFASVVLLTQPTVKVALGYSSAAHMGFMLMICGLGVFPAAILHLVAHSFYKAHAFLSSASVIDVARAKQIALPRRLGNPLRITASIAVATAVYLGFAWLWGVKPMEQPALLVIGAILVMGLAQIIAPALDSSGTLGGTLRACLLAVSVALAFFSLEAGAHHLLRSVLPELPELGLVSVALSGVILLACATAVLFQIYGPSLPESSWRRSLAIHLRNGCYANAVFDRAVGALRTK